MHAVRVGYWVSFELETLECIEITEFLAGKKLKLTHYPDALRAVCDLDLTDLQAIGPPQGFGRD